MTAPVTPAQAEHELRRLARRLEAKCDELPGLLRAAAEADVAYRLAYSKALVAAEGDTVAEREAQATLAVAEELRRVRRPRQSPTRLRSRFEPRVTRCTA
jgi:hypothetical protein